MNLIRTIAILGIVISSAFTLSSPATAQSAPAKEPQNFEARIAILNLFSIRREALVVKDIDAQILEFQKAFRTSIRKEEETLRAGNQELAKKRSILSPEAFAEERRLFEQKVVAVQRSVQERKRALDQLRVNAMSKVEAALNKIIQEIATTNNVNLVLRREQTVLSSRAMEITAQVLEKINIQLPKLKVEKPGK